MFPVADFNKEKLRDASLLGERQLRAAVDRLPGLVAYIDRNYRYRFVNASYGDWFGWKSEDLIGKTMGETFGPGIFEIVQPYMDRALSGELVVFEHSHSLRSTPHHVKVTYIPDRAVDGSVQGIVVVVEDTTERREAEQALRESEERYRALINASSQYVWTAGGIRGTNPRNIEWWTDLTGQSLKDLPHDGWLEMVHPDDRDRVAAQWNRATTAREQQKLEYRLKARDGTYRDVVVRGVPIWNEDGSFREWIGTLADVTSQKQAEEILRASEERFRRIVETAAEGICTIDPQGRITPANDRIAKALGYSSDEVKGRWAFDFVFEEDREDALAKFRVVQSGDAEPFELRLRRRDGTPLWVNVSTAPLRDEHGALIAVLAMFTDISKRKQAEQEQKAIERQLTLLIEASSALLATPGSPEVLNTILDLAKKFIDADAYSLWRKVKNRNEWRIGISEGLSSQYASVIAGPKGNVQELLKEPLVIEDVEKAPVSEQRVSAYKAEGIKSLIIVPLRIHGELAAAIDFCHHSPHRFTHLEIRVAEGLANLAAAALGTAELYDRESRLRQLAQADERRASFLAEAGQVLSSSLDYEATLASVVDLAVPSFADWASVSIAEPSGELRRVAIKHSDPAMLVLADEYDRRFPPSDMDAARVALRTHESVLIEDMSDSVASEDSSSLDHTRFVRDFGLNSLIIAPLVANNKAFGTLSFVTAESGRRYNKADLALAEELARRAATAVHNARLFSESSAAQEALRLSNGELQRANEDLNQFAFSASHDLQEPIRMVAVYSQMLERKYGPKLDLEARQYLDFTVQGAKRMEMLVRDLLAYTRVLNIPGGGPEHAASDANEVLQRALENLKAAIDENRAEIRRGVLPILPIHEIHLLQLFQNLIGNAIKYRSVDPPRISISSGTERGEVIIRIKDNGIGVPAQYADRIFGIFKRLHGADQYPGTGIGLAICHKIAERYGGRIWVEPEQGGGGSTFCFALPAAA